MTLEKPLSNFFSLLQANAGALFLVLLVFLLLLSIWQVVTFSELRRLKVIYARLTQGAKGSSLEQILLQQMEQVRAAMARMEELDSALHALQRASEYDLQHLGIVRFNPFTNTGGDQSFTLALTDAHGDGALITSLHSRDGTRIYARALHAWDAMHLGDEERQAIAQARERRRNGS
ncbi:MAG: DUF4446 family protein [Anaerolineae bacterium]|nr:DUF4446 family protein [Anaerolineae bacterium]